MMYILRTNYGDNSIALCQWAYEQGLKNVYVVYIDTGFAAKNWKHQVLLGEQHAKRCGFEVIHIKAPITFIEATLGRGEFPSAKFQWCTGILKGLPFLDWLETIDLRGQATIMLGASNGDKNEYEFQQNDDKIPGERVENSPHYNDRTLWYPLLNLSAEEQDALLQRANFVPQKIRSLECHPCVKSSLRDIASLNEAELERVEELEERLQMPFFPPENFGNQCGIRNVYQYAKEQDSLCAEGSKSALTGGCSNYFGCGL